MAKRTTEALLLSRDADLADRLDEALAPLGVRVVRNAPPPREGTRPPAAPKADPRPPLLIPGPPLLIVDGRDYLGACLPPPLPPPQGRPSGERPSSPTLLLVGPEDADTLPVPLQADEVMCLPIRPQELRLRVRNLLGPSLSGPLRQPSAGSSSAGRRKRRAGLELDEERYEISLDGEPLSLTFREYELLKYLMTHPGRTFTREHLLARVWGEDYLGGTRTVDVHIRRLRMKVEAGGRACIRTVRSVGYKFVG